jgi:hypothetical protein
MYFVDAGVITAALVAEQKEYGDLVFRSECRLMDRHPLYVNYGNALPVYSASYNTSLPHAPASASHVVNSSTSSSPRFNATEAEDYPFRRFYKIDWKVCFLRHWLPSSPSPSLSPSHSFHVFVEDDSFVCLENLLHQLGLLEPRIGDKKPAPAPGAGVGAGAENKSSSPGPVTDSLQPGQHVQGRPFRTGTSLWDGWDDSSTIMSREVAVAFVRHYRPPSAPPSAAAAAKQQNQTQGQGRRILQAPAFLSPQLETPDPALAWACPRVLPFGPQESSTWLSWGNSWRVGACSWRAALRSAGLLINEPTMHCLSVNRDVLSALGFIDTRGAPVTRQSFGQDKAPELWAQQGEGGGGAGADVIDASRLCRPSLPLVLHHPKAATVLARKLNASHLAHACEALLLVDKVKEPLEVFHLWNSATGNAFSDFSAVFMWDRMRGWAALLDRPGAEAGGGRGRGRVRGLRAEVLDVVLAAASSAGAAADEADLLGYS